MNKKHITLGIILVVGGFILFGVIKGPSTVTTRIALSGPDGLKITGSLTADGKEQDVNEILPAEITITAKRMSLLVKSSDESETLSAKVYVNDKERVSGAQQRIQIDVTGNTLFSSKPKTHLKSY